MKEFFTRSSLMEASTRLYIQNLPSYLSENRLKTIFNTKGVVTDVKILKNPFGKSRQCGFIGFSSESESKAALKYFDNTYIDTSKIRVQYAFPYGDSRIPHSFSKHNQNKLSSISERKKNQIQKKENNDIRKSDDKLDTFIELFSKRKPIQKKNATPEESSFKKDSSDDEYFNNPSIDTSKEEEEIKLPTLFIQKPSKPNQFDDCRLFIRNLPFSCKEEDLRDLFSSYGNIVDIHVPSVEASSIHKGKGFAFIKFELPAFAARARMELDGIIFQGRLLHILPSRPFNKTISRNDNLSYKDNQQVERKEIDSKLSWNTLYINSNTILDAVADQLKISKSELFSPNASDLGINLAVNETKIIDETKHFLIDNGIDISVFEKSLQNQILSIHQKSDFSHPLKTKEKLLDKEGILKLEERSDTVILVKNIPYSTTENELYDLFIKYGPLSRVLLAPSKTIAIIYFIHPNNAKNAYQSLIYSTFKNNHLYLEFAPVALKSLSKFNHALKTEEEIEENENERTIYVKNLNFSTTEEKLKSVFKKKGEILNIKIAKKLLNGECVSMGYCFIEYSKVEEANEALRELQHVEIDAHRLELALTSHKKSNDSSVVNILTDSQLSSLATTKLLVKNIPFEASKKEVKKLFHLYGEVKGFRLPRKFDGAHRGFAFVEFVSKEEAIKAYKKLFFTHLYGRHLILEWAKDQEELNDRKLQSVNFETVKESSYIEVLSSNIRESKTRKRKRE